jgi:hypothetical protein
VRNTGIDVGLCFILSPENMGFRNHASIAFQLSRSRIESLARVKRLIDQDDFEAL